MAEERKDKKGKEGENWQDGEGEIRGGREYKRGT